MYHGRPSVALNPEQLIRRTLRGSAYPTSDFFPTIRTVTAKPADYQIGIYESRIPASSFDAENAYSQKQEADQVSFRTPEPVEHASQPFALESHITKYKPEVQRVLIEMVLDELFGQDQSSPVDTWTDDTESADPLMADALDNALTDASSSLPEADLGEHTFDDAQSNSLEATIDDVLEDDSGTQDASLDTIIDEVMGEPAQEDQPEDEPPEVMELAPY